MRFDLSIPRALAIPWTSNHRPALVIEMLLLAFNITA
jgi:hypothetical protein